MIRKIWWKQRRLVLTTQPTTKIGKWIVKMLVQRFKVVLMTPVANSELFTSYEKFGYTTNQSALIVSDVMCDEVSGKSWFLKKPRMSLKVKLSLFRYIEMGLLLASFCVVWLGHYINPLVYLLIAFILVDFIKQTSTAK